jgi:hypothetical protein
MNSAPCPGSFQFVGGPGKECPLHDISLLQSVEREIERVDNRKEFERKISRRQPLRYAMRIDTYRRVTFLELRVPAYLPAIRETGGRFVGPSQTP